MNGRRALITGIAGQDGSYLAELLLSKGYAVHGFVRPGHAGIDPNYLWRISAIRDQLCLHEAVLEDDTAVASALSAAAPDECYHLAATSTIQYGATDERQTLRANIEGTHNVLSLIRDQHPHCRVFVAASSEVFGNASICPQNEQTPFHPRSAYGVSKAAAYWLVQHFRESYGLFRVSGITYNHESPRRGAQFVTRKISMGVASIVNGLSTRLELRSLTSTRDWGHAAEYLDAMWRSLQQDVARDYVFATGHSATIRDFCDAAFSEVGLDYRAFVELTTALPVSVETAAPLIGDASRARACLGWTATLTYRDIAREMVASDLERAGSST
jgi:GDPmannose 4,6-dehydratase